MDKEIIYKGKLEVDQQSLKIVIEAGLDEAGTARFYALVDNEKSVELLHNPDTHQWEELKNGATQLAKACGEIVDGFYS
ncbi:hypothetical protein ACTJIJ_14945 [Niabella sp. 22666]|uniref:hypothetical protein n=1 Tax=Niabella sp. 22666 TaxID=3453954 RepID=UPI003F8676CC